MSPFVQIAVLPSGSIVGLCADGRLYQTAGLHDGRLAWVQMPTDQRFASAPMLDGQVVRQADLDAVYRPTSAPEISSRPS